MRQRMHISLEKLALALYDEKIFLYKTQSPGGLGFSTKAREANPDLPLSPFYVNFRLLRSIPAVHAQLIEVLRRMLVGKSPDLIADIPTAITPTVAGLSLATGFPMVSPRLQKDYGLGSTVDGIYRAGQRVTVFDDVLSTAKSKFDACETLKLQHLIVNTIIVFVDRQQGGGMLLSKAGYEFQAVWTISYLLCLYRKERAFPEAAHHEILRYLS